MITVVIQARLSSTRLPGKVLKPILKQPMLFLELERIARSRRIDEMVVATSVESDDNPLAELCQRKQIKCFRGSLDNVLDRFYRAAKTSTPDHVVRLTGDCPLIDPEIIDAVVELHLKGDYDYTCNTNPPTFPDGLDTEVMKFSALSQAWEKATALPELEHVTQYFIRRPHEFKMGNLTSEHDFSQLRWTVDEPQDFTFISRIYEELYPKNPAFDYHDILELIQEHPKWLELNSRFTRNEGLLKSLAEEAKILQGIKR